jgi:Dienelactone hydrolase and related enzymes
MKEQNVTITTQNGAMPAFAVCPDGEGPWPAILFYMDARGMREELRNMARRLAKHGYYVLLPDLYYRFGHLGFDLLKRDESMVLMIRAARLSISRKLLVSDTAAMIAFLDAQGEVAEGKMGSVGYCMGGPFITWGAAAFPSRIAAAAGLYPVEMVVDNPDSPHLCLPQIEARLYYGFAELDHFGPPELIKAFREAVEANGSDCLIDVFPGVDHGFCFPERPVHAPEPSERHWERLFTLFDGTLKG